MNWCYVDNGKQAGPVTDEQLDQLARSGSVNRDTLVWREGMTEWQPLSVARGGASPQVPPAILGMKTCAECGKLFPPDAIILLNQNWVCAACKPLYLQKLSEGVGVGAGGAGLWRMNRQLVTVSETPFPDRCVKCNQPANGYRLKRVLYWQHPAYYLLLFCNLLILLIVVLIVRKKAVLYVGLCETHQAARKRALLIGGLGGIGGAAALVGGIVAQSPWLALFGALSLLGCLIYAGLKAPMVSAAKIDKKNVWLKGAHPDFLATLPEWPNK